MHDRTWIEANVIGPQIGGLLSTSSSVVKEQQQGSVAQSKSALGRKSGQRGFDLITFEKNGLERLCAFSRNRDQVLGLTKPLREPRPDVFEEATQCVQT